MHYLAFWFEGVRFENLQAKAVAVFLFFSYFILISAVILGSK